MQSMLGDLSRHGGSMFHLERMKFLAQGARLTTFHSNILKLYVKEIFDGLYKEIRKILVPFMWMLCCHLNGNSGVGKSAFVWKRVTDYKSGSEEAKEITQRVNAAEMAFEWFGGNQGAHLHALKHAPGGAQVETCVRVASIYQESSKIHGEALWVSRFLHLNPWNLSVFGFRHPSLLPFVLGRLDALDDRRILLRLGVRKGCVRERSNCVRIDAAELLDQLVPSPARQARCVVEREGMENVAFVWVQPDGELRGIQATQTSRDGSFPLHRGRRIPKSLSPRETVAALKSNGLDGIF
ncbi:hypothetical protein SELMODRAFT_425846 [Selaginella moellendorffii]|uniref:Uncharacterized protein n=1 Tax=Selaginella moellendorffii TaxID=88036 RepID=D8SUH5_SELML|nr:hypothetical protein SELMODRAFT_425846 [Selaginella moellendorffii]